MSHILQIHPDDNVAVALEPLKAGETLETSAGTVTLREDIPQGHKLALMDIPSGAVVVKYGFPIGHATQTIHVGDWVHSHDLATSLDGEAVTSASIAVPTRSVVPASRTFQGFRRKGGVGIRNEIWIIPTVGCVNSVAETLARIVSRDIRGSVTGVYAWPHPYGCSQTGGDQEHTRRILCDLIRHPNAGGVLVLGLGCENSNIGELKKLLGNWDPERTAFLECQSVPDELEAGRALLRRLIDHAAKDVRCSIPASELVIGLKCGGSDGLSGITANPLVGRIADRLVAMGGTALLAEVPEMFGAEGVLFRRCADETVQKELPALVADFKDYFVRHGQVVYENPSPGNKAGGITTLEEKSLGCVQKGGSSPICGVLSYGQRVQNRGLTVLQTPGNDLVSTTALAAAGAHMVLFTTGRGTPFAGPVPTLKISTSTALAQRKPRWIDFNAGTLVQGDSWDDAVEALLDRVMATASGLGTCAESLGYRELAIWKDGVTL
ncbi:MAG: altronate dehydratase [Clostridiales bacterium]|nr:altronate dehydratase [Clostridiales bacterium]